MVVIRGRFYARPFDSDRSISPIYCTISRTKDLRVHLSPCTPAQSARPWTVSVAFRILIADEMNFAPKKIFFSAKMLLFSKNSDLIVASITGASKRGFKRFVPRISTVYPAWFRAAIFPSRKGKIFDAAGRIEKRAVAVSIRWMVSGIPKAFSIVLPERLRVHEPSRCSFA